MTMIKDEIKEGYLERVCINIIFIVLIVLLSIYNTIGNPFIFDYANIKTKDITKTNLEIYCQLSNTDLQFMKSDDNYIAKGATIAVLYVGKGNFVKVGRDKSQEDDCSPWLPNQIIKGKYKIWKHLNHN